jgi:hypothetical protein
MTKDVGKPWVEQRFAAGNPEDGVLQIRSFLDEPLEQAGIKPLKAVGTGGTVAMETA